MHSKAGRVMRRKGEGRKWASKVKLQNSAGHAISFTLEPWGDEHRIPSGMTAHIAGRSVEEGCFHIELTDEGVQVWAMISRRSLRSRLRRPWGKGRRGKPDQTHVIWHQVMTRGRLG